MSLVKVYYTRIDAPLSLPVFETYVRRLPADQQVKNSRLRRWEDRHAHLYTRLQLMEGLAFWGLGDAGLDRMQYDGHGRPFMAGAVDFNFSHTGGYALCAIGRNVRIGVDIERCSRVDLDDYRSTMSDAQWADIVAAPEPLSTFFSYWARKEAVVKADGRAMGIPLATVSFDGGAGWIEGVRWPLYDLDIDPVCPAWLSCDREDVTVSIERYRHR
jgi:4'-phosphopantetheinyl transferase